MEDPADAHEADNALAARVADGDEEAVRRLFDRHAPGLYRALYRLLGDGDRAHDAVQTTFLRAVREIDAFRGGSLGGWLRTMAFRIGLNEIRAERRRREREGRWAAERAVSDPGARTDLIDAVERLPDRYRRVVLLFYFEDLPHERIAEVLGIPVGTSKGWLSRARDELRRMLTPERQR